MFQLHNINANDKNFIASSSETENSLNVSERIACSDKVNISDISNILDSSLMSYLNNESICTPSTRSETFPNIDEQTHCNTNDELRENRLNENYIDNNIIDTENEALPLHKNNKKLLAMKTILHKNHIHRNITEDNTVNNVPSINMKIKGKFKVFSILYTTLGVF